MRSDPAYQSPVNPVPPVVLALFVAIIGIELVFSLGEQNLIGGPQAIGWRSQAIRDFGFNTQVVEWMWESGRVPPEFMMRFVTYPFVHGSFTTALIGGALVLALGKFVGDQFRGWAVLALFFMSCIGGAVTYGMIAPGQPYLVGAYPGVYGLIGGFTYLVWLRLGQLGERQVRAFSLIGFLLGVQLVFGLLFGDNGWWIADLGGFATGFAASILLSPGGFARLRARLRHD